MKRPEEFMLIVSVVLCMAVGSGAAAELRVGIFDSRAVAIAYAQSAPFQERIREMKAAHRRAEEAGDEERAGELEEQGQSLQHLLHMQGFGTWPIDEILASVRDEIPDLAREAGVDLIVSRWDVVYRRSDVELVNVTEYMMKPFDPSAKLVAELDEIWRTDPVPNEELEEHHH